MNRHPIPDDVTGQRILITGGAGFIGSHLADALGAHNDVHILDTMETGRPANIPDDASLIEGDVRNQSTVTEALTDVDIVYHQAALVSVQQSINEPHKSHSINVDGTLTVLEAARRRDSQVLVASSAAVYGQPESVPIPEEAAKNPTSPYSLDKLTADRYTRLYHELYGLRTADLRPFNVYGPVRTGATTAA